MWYPIFDSYSIFHSHLYINVQCDHWHFYVCLKRGFCGKQILYTYTTMTSMVEHISQSLIIRTYSCNLAVYQGKCLNLFFIFCRRYNFLFYFMIRISSRWWWHTKSHISIINFIEYVGFRFSSRHVGVIISFAFYNRQL